MQEILNYRIVRIDKKGNEVHKPVRSSYSQFDLEHGDMRRDIDIYARAKKVIKLPTLIEFDEWLDTIDELYETKWAWSMKYRVFLQTQLSEGLFVNRLVDPRTEHDIQQDSIGNARMLQKGEKQFHEAEDRVIFEGVIVVGNDIWMNTYRLGKVGFKKEWLFNDDTINQALNNGVTLYMKIK